MERPHRFDARNALRVAAAAAALTTGAPATRAQEASPQPRTESFTETVGYWGNLPRAGAIDENEVVARFLSIAPDNRFAFWSTVQHDRPEILDMVKKRIGLEAILSGEADMRTFWSAANFSPLQPRHLSSNGEDYYDYETVYDFGWGDSDTPQQPIGFHLDTTEMRIALERTDTPGIFSFWNSVETTDLGTRLDASLVDLAISKTTDRYSRDAFWRAFANDTGRTWTRFIDVARFDAIFSAEPEFQSEIVGHLVRVLDKPQFGDFWRQFPTPPAEKLARMGPLGVAQYIERYSNTHGLSLPSWKDAAIAGTRAWILDTFAPGAHPQPGDATTLVSIINNLHVLPKDQRASLLEGITPETLYLAVVSGESELYTLGTSAFREHFAPRLLEGMRSAGGLLPFLARADSAGSHSVVFLRIASAFGALDDFMKTPEELDAVLSQVFAAISGSNEGLTTATVLLDLLTPRGVSPATQKLRKATESRLVATYQGETDPIRKRIFGTALSVYADTVNDVGPEIRTIAATHESAALPPLTEKMLFHADKAGRLTHTARMYFFPGADGQSSYDHFMQTFEHDGAWKCSRYPTYAECTRSVGNRRVRILMNLPTEQGLSDGNRTIDMLLDSGPVDSLVMRGHSSSMPRFLELIRDRRYQPAIVHLGACGAFTHLANTFSILGKPAYLLATKGTGSMRVNDPVLRDEYASLLTEDLSASRPFSFPRFKDKMTQRFAKEDAQVRSYFAAYQWPHEYPNARFAFALSDLFANPSPATISQAQ